MSVTPQSPAISESQIILLVGLIQFFNILDFMMVMPLGPDFARALNIPASDIGLIGGSYTFAAGIAGIIAALFLDQYARKKAVLVCLAGLTIATFAGALVWDKSSMLAARIAAGLFGGPLASLSQALIADYIATERRGRAMGKVAGAFAAASVLGVPFGLELSARISWHAPFIVTSLLGVAIGLLVIFKLPHHPPYAAEKPFKERVGNLFCILRSGLPLKAYSMTMLTMMAGFMIIPNIAAHLQMNVGYPREHLGLLYFFGGAVSFFSMRGAGWLVDKTSASLVALGFTGLLFISLAAGFIWYEPLHLPVVLIFVFFMVAMSGRTVTIQTVSSKIPHPSVRGAYMSLQMALTHLGTATGAYYSSLVLVTEGDKMLHMPQVALTAMGISFFIPLMLWNVERTLKRRENY